MPPIRKTQSGRDKNQMQSEKFNMLNEDQKFINVILDKYGLEIKWLADKIRMEPDLLRYQLREAVNYRQDVHERIIKVLKKEGYVTNNKEVCDKLKDDLIDFSSVMSGTISIITKSVREKIKDNVFDINEKQQLKSELRRLLARVTDEFNDLLITIDLK